VINSVNYALFKIGRKIMTYKSLRVNPSYRVKHILVFSHISDKKEIYIVSWHMLGHAIKLVTCFDLQFWRSTRPMTSFCIFIAYINTEPEGILFNVKITRWDWVLVCIFPVKSAWWNLNDQSPYFQSILKYNLLGLHSRNGHEL
jgi:hypothetical protein